MTQAVDWPIFSHEAMATTFQIAIAGQDPGYAGQAASAAFRELERLEQELSRFVETSDIACANRLGWGESLLIGEDSLRCLTTAVEISSATHRCFDAAYGSERPPDLPASDPIFSLDPALHLLTSHSTALRLDLGAIGKGYALDRMALLLREWEIETACLHAGGSTVLALKPPPDLPGWPVAIAGATLAISGAAISASGIGVRGRHLWDPRMGRPASRRKPVWSYTSDAAAADALSTGLFVMADREIATFCNQHPEWVAIISPRKGKLIFHGHAATGARALHSQRNHG